MSFSSVGTNVTVRYIREQESVVRGSTVKFIKVNKVVIIFESEDDLL